MDQNCPNCGSSNIPDAIFCARCGSPLTATARKLVSQRERMALLKGIIIPAWIMCFGLLFIILAAVIPDRRYLVPHSAEYYEMINVLNLLQYSSIIPIWIGGILIWRYNKGAEISQIGLIAIAFLTVLWLAVALYNMVLAI